MAKKDGKYIMIDGTMVWVPDTPVRDHTELVDYIIKEEGFLKEPTDIGDGKITLGSGLTDPKWHKLYRQRGNKWSEEDNRKAVEEEIRVREKKLESSFPNWGLLPQKAQEALLAYNFNYNFTPENSPNMFKAAANKDFRELGNQIDATSKDPKFKRGLEQRRKRERDYYFSGFPEQEETPAVQAPTPVFIPSAIENIVPTDAIRNYRPEIIPSSTRRDAYKAMQDKVNFNRFMDSISIQNNLPVYTPQSNIHEEGGKMEHPEWNALSIPEKAAMIKVAVQNGITNLPEIRAKYNEFSKGGPRKKSAVSGNAQKAMNYFMDKGLSQHQAAGLVGNLMRESSMSPTAVNSGSGAYGLAQWLGPRKKALFAKYGNSPTLDQQLDFVWNELNSTHKRGLKALKNSKTAEEAARNAMGYYEFMAGPNAAIREMKKYGQDGEGSMRKGINYASQLMGASPSRTPISPTTPVNPITPIASQESLESPIPFILANPEAFFGTSITYQQPIIEFPEITQTTSPEVLARQQKEAERQENQAKLQNMMNILGMVYGNSPEDSNNSLISTLGLLTGSTFAKGGKIHIKPENRGKFTALKKRTGHSATWFKEHGTPAQKKMAIFALNARKWKHGLGGNLFDGLTEDSQQMNRLSSISLIDQLEASRWNPVSLKTISENARQQNRGKTNKRLRGNASFTKQGSERMENAMDSYLVKSQREKGSSNSAYDIPFIPEKAIVVDGSITSTNTLDSLAKYAGIHNRNPKLSQKTILKRSNYTAPRAINKDEMLGLSTQETHNGALPYFNYKDNSEYNKILGNSNYFTAFGYLPAENFVRDFHYNKDNIDRNIPPLLDAFQYFAQGDYNRGDAGHTMSVNNAGKRAWQNPKVKQWWEESGKYWYNNGKGKDEE